MSIVHAQSPPTSSLASSYMLVHPDAPVWYSFSPAGMTVTVKRSARGASIREVYTLAVEDARQLWRFLRAKGFEEF